MDQTFTTLLLEAFKGNEWWHISTSILIWLTVITTLLGLLITAIYKIFVKLNLLYKSLEENNKRKPSVDYSAQVFKNPSIRYILRDIRHDTQADRVTIYQFHNGETSIASNPFLKVSCTNEVLSKDAISVIDYMIEKHIDIFDGVVTSVFNDKIYKQKFVSDLHKDGNSRTLAQTLTKIGVTSIYVFPVKSALGKIFGFGTIEYCCNPTDLESNWLEWSQNKFAQVGVLLSIDSLNNVNTRLLQKEEEKSKSNNNLLNKILNPISYWKNK